MQMASGNDIIKKYPLEKNDYNHLKFVLFAGLE